MAIFNLNTGEKLTNRQIKAEIQRRTGWSNAEYNKQYDILRNQVRTYERATGTKIGAVNEFLYKEQLSKTRYGRAYKPSNLVRAVRETQSISTGERAQIAQARNIQARVYRGVFRNYEKLAQKYKPVGEYIKAVKSNPNAYTLPEVIKELRERARELEEYQKAKAREYSKRGGAYPTGKRLRGAYDAGSTYQE